MAITFSSAEGDPHRDFSNDVFGCFTHDARTWPTVTIYALAMRHDDPAVGEKLARAWETPDARAIERELADQRLPGWAEREPAIVRHAMERKFESSLGLRARLLATGDEALVCDDDDAVGPALMAVRARCRRRASDAHAVQCEHQDATDLRRACVHLLDGAEGLDAHRRFTGHRVEHLLVCPPCAAAEPVRAEALRWLCADCFGARLHGKRGGDVGSVECATRDDGLRLDLTRVPFPEAPYRAVVASPAPYAWIALDAGGRLLCLDAARASVEVLATLPDGAITADVEVDLHASPDGALVAAVEAHGTRGVVVDLRSGEATMRLARGDYQVDHCRFPAAFIEHRGRTLLAHGTDWNRLDVSDPRTGEIVTARAQPEYRSGEPLPPHYLDCFHGALHASPDGRWLLDDAWVWHPVGVVRAFSAARWLDDDVWESEDGASLRALAWRDSHWDTGLCWVDATTAAVWGLGDDDVELLPGVTLYDVTTGEAAKTLAGPARNLASDEGRLYAFAPGHGLSAWDVATGERTLHEPAFAPTGYHRASRCFWVFEGGALVLGRVQSSAASVVA